LIGCVIEGASETKYSETKYVDFVRQNILVPAQMGQTQADNRFAIIAYRTRFYEKTESGTIRTADFLDSSYKIPGGGWLSSAEDPNACLLHTPKEACVANRLVST
jgi:serine beta-lactamase-like protein LACTB, mitochondrial